MLVSLLTLFGIGNNMAEINYEEEYSVASNQTAHEVIRKMFPTFIDDVDVIFGEIDTVEEALFVEALMEQSMRHVLETTYEKPKSKTTNKNKARSSG